MAKPKNLPPNATKHHPLNTYPEVDLTHIAKTTRINRAELHRIANKTYSDTDIPTVHNKLRATNPDLKRIHKARQLAHALLNEGHRQLDIAIAGGIHEARLTSRGLERALTPTTVEGIERAWKKLHGAPPLPYVPNTRFKRIVDALAVLGWSSPAITAATAIPRTTLQKRHTYDTVKAPTERKLIRFYEQVRYAPGPSERIANQAKAQGFAPWTAWADDSISDPDAVPVDVKWIEDPIWRQAIMDRYHLNKETRNAASSE